MRKQVNFIICSQRNPILGNNVGAKIVVLLSNSLNNVVCKIYSKIHLNICSLLSKQMLKYYIR